LARKSGPRQLKREPAPGFWPIRRKERTWAPNTRPGPHSREKSLPLVIIIRDILGYARTSKEATRIISTGKVKIDGIVRRDHRYPVGLMDVLQIEGADQIFRILPKPNRGLIPTPISAKEAGFKLCKIVGKRNVEGGKVQINLHDGRSVILPTQSPRQKGEAEFAPGGAVQIGLPKQNMMGTVPFQTGALGLVIDGRNQGTYGKITTITPGTHARPKIVKIETATEAFDTPAEYVIPVGTHTSLVGLGEK
jgi:small subunit ribosomal protein S4e